MLRSLQTQASVAIRCAVLAVVGFLSLCATAGEDPGQAFFSSTEPLQVEITVSSNDFSTLNRRTRNYVPVLVRCQTNAPVRAGLRLRGFSSFQPIERKPAFALKFNDPNAEKQFGGLSKLLFNNCVADSCCMREHVANALFREAGVPAARIRPVRVRINGRDIGICLAVEAMNKDFLRHNFGNVSGNLYEGTTRDIDQPLELDNGSDSSGNDLRDLLTAAREPNPTERLKKMNAILDIDRFLRFAAVQVILGHSDGYLGNRNNYRIYHDSSSGQMVFIPHGLDTAFMQGWTVVPTNNIVMQALYSIPEVRRRYVATCSLLMSNVWQSPLLTDQIERAQRSVNDLADGPTVTQQSSSCVDFLTSQLIGRRLEVMAWLSEPEPKLLSLALAQSTTLTNWTSFIRFGTPSLSIETDYNGRFLRVDASTPAAGGWRSRVVVPEGDYTFSCRAMAKRRISSDGMIPAFLFRIAGELRGVALARMDEWESLQYSFSAPPDGRVVEFLCELQTGKGEIRIDLASVKVTRNR